MIKQSNNWDKFDENGWPEVIVLELLQAGFDTKEEKKVAAACV